MTDRCLLNGLWLRVYVNLITMLPNFGKLVQNIIQCSMQVREMAGLFLRGSIWTLERHLPPSFPLLPASNGATGYGDCIYLPPQRSWGIVATPLRWAMGKKTSYRRDVLIACYISIEALTVHLSNKIALSIAKRPCTGWWLHSSNTFSLQCY